MVDHPDSTPARRLVLADIILCMPNREIMIPPEMDDGRTNPDFAKRTIPHMYKR
jgi:hypothetical protein